MNYSDITQALKDNVKVFWINPAYKVFLQNGELFVIYVCNDYMTKLNESEYTECFKG
jgi:hypothetical protein